jgi:GntR family transcriptional regulator
VEEISAQVAGSRMASKLRISENDPILKRKRFVYDDKGIPVEYNIGYYNANSFTYTITAER